MSKDKSKPASGGKGGPAPVDRTRAKSEPLPPSPEKSATPATAQSTRFFRRCDWISFGITALLVFIGYYLTLAPEVTLEDSGELAVGSFYAGVPHPPGYPVWTLYTWLFTVLVPFSNIAWRVALSSAVAGALSCGVLALITSRGSSMVLESIDAFKNIDRKAENLLCIAAGWIAGMLIGFNGFMWSQAVIVEVYTLSVLSLVLTYALLMRWLYTPDQARWLLLAFFVFGVCFTNHQTLICAAMGIEVLIAFGKPKLGRDLILGNVVAYLVGVILRSSGIIVLFEGNIPVLIIFHVVGLLSAAAYVTLLVKNPKPVYEVFRDWVLYGLLIYLFFTIFAFKGEVVSSSGGYFVWFTLGCGLVGGSYYLLRLTWKTFRDWLVPILCGVTFIIGTSFYLYMPISSMTNPPMNWGYPRTVEGFIHAFTRGQYEKTSPTDSVAKFADQCWMLVDGAIEEFNPVYLLIALLPFVFLMRMRNRERAWIIGQSAIYLCLSVLLIYLLNPGSDKQSHDLTRVFFTASHVTIAMFAGYGLALIAGILQNAYKEYRDWLLYGGAIMSAIALYGVAWVMMNTAYPLDRFNAYFGLASMVAITLVVLLSRDRVHLGVFLGLVAITPLYSVMAHWSDNEQRGHLFGWWFGHDMFTPPFTAPDGKLSYDPQERRKLLADPKTAKLVYPEMAKSAILFGGTDPGRFCPTYMIFCESFIKPTQRRDPNFDRRDVYIITQNALADHTYLSYIRAQYDRSTQQDPPFFQALLLSDRERSLPAADQWKIAGDKTLSKVLLLSAADHIFTDLGAKIEARRRAEGVYPPNEIYTPTPQDSADSFEIYLQDAARRKKLNQLRPGEIVDIVPAGDGHDRIQVAGQVSVMAINGILAKTIFDHNPTNEFYVEESFPLDWMFPHLTPYGIIMKINRQNVPELTEDDFQRDRQFWTDYSDRLIGNWIKEDTSVKEICEFVQKVYVRRDYTGFKGDPKFIRDDQAQKSFSKLRGAIAGIYLWRLGLLTGVPTPSDYLPKTEAQRARLTREAEFAWKQSFAFCPYSPEAVFKYASLLLNIPGRLADARLITETALELDPNNDQFRYLHDQIDKYQQNESTLTEVQKQVSSLAATFEKDKANITSAFHLAEAYAQLQRSNDAFAVLDTLLAQTNVTHEAVLQAAIFAQQLRNVPLMERALLRLTQVSPESPEAWYDLAAMQSSLGKLDLAAKSLRQAVVLSDRRLKTNSTAKDLRKDLATESRFAPLRARPDWEMITRPE